jgi:GDP-L-fucose synthase
MLGDTRSGDLVPNHPGGRVSVRDESVRSPRGDILDLGSAVGDLRLPDLDGPGVLDRTARVYIAGNRGLVGSALWRRFQAEGFTNLHGAPSSELDLRDREAVFEYFSELRPQYVILAAAKVGGILANNTYPVDFLSDNLRIQTNVMDAALAQRSERLLFLGSSCIYPAHAPQPIRERSLLTGHLEPTNEAYAIAKIAGILNVQAVRRQYGLRWISAMPTNLYGPGDNFSPSGSHVLPSLIRRYDEAYASGAPVVTNWGSGTPRREFLHVDDMADACLHLLDHYDGHEHVNVGTGRDATIREIAEVVAETVGFGGTTEWDLTKPDGMMQKRLDITKLRRLGWEPKIGLREGLASTVSWYRHHNGALRQAG